MKITNEQLRRIIKEELEQVLSEQTWEPSASSGKTAPQGLRKYDRGQAAINKIKIAKDTAAEKIQLQPYLDNQAEVALADAAAANKKFNALTDQEKAKNKADRERLEQSENFQAYLRDALNDPTLGATLDNLRLGNQAEAKAAVKEVMIELGLGSNKEASNDEIEKIRNALKTKNRTWFQKAGSWLTGKGFKQ